jgi:hypothetical protein
MHFALSNLSLARAQGIQDFGSPRQGFIAGDIQKDSCRLAMFGDNHELPTLTEFLENLAGLTFHITYGNQSREHFVPPFVPNMAPDQAEGKGHLCTKVD